MIAIVPDEPLKSLLERERQTFAQTYNVSMALRNPVHITIVPPFHAPEDVIGTLRAALGNMAAFHWQFSLELIGYNSFPKNRVFFIEGEHNSFLMKLRSGIFDVFASYAPSVNLILMKGNYSPHVTLGYRDLERDLFEQVLSDYKGRTFSATWPVTNFQLWKRDNNEWIVVEQFELG